MFKESEENDDGVVVGNKLNEYQQPGYYYERGNGSKHARISK